jgi:hypothetical protein
MRNRSWRSQCKSGSILACPLHIHTYVRFPPKKTRGPSPRANYTDRATAAYRRSLCQLLWIEGATWLAWRIPTAVFSTFKTGTATFSFKQLLICTHEAEWTPFPTHYFSEKLVAPVLEPGPLRSVARNSWPLDHRGDRVWKDAERNDYWLSEVHCPRNAQSWTQTH